MDPRVTATSGAALEASLDAELTAIEEEARYGVDLDERYTRASRIGTAARTDLRLRAELIRSDIVGRRGDIIASGQSCRQVNTWPPSTAAFAS